MEANQENIRSDDDIRRNSLYEALAKAQAEFPIIPKNKTGKITGKSKATGKEYSYEYKYADITDVLAAVRPILSKHGLAIIQKTQETEKEIIFTTKLVHNSGQSESATLFINKNQHPQDLGSIITYYPGIT